MNFRRRGPYTDALRTPPEILVFAVTAENALGSLPCSALRCTSVSAVSCSYVDRRERHCKTAWCPDDRQVIADQIYCPVHAHTISGIEHEFGSSIRPDVDNRMPAIISWMAAAAADDIVATLNLVCSLRREVVVTDPVRRVFHPIERTRVWEKQWKTLSTTGIGLRVCIAADEARPNEIHIRINNTDVNMVPPPWNQALGPPNDADLEWLYQEVLMPISHRVDAWLSELAIAEQDGGYAADATMMRSATTAPASWSRDFAAELRGQAALWLSQPDAAAACDSQSDPTDHSGELRRLGTG